MEERLFLNACNEMYVIDLTKVLYLQADDHYTIVNLSSGMHFMVSFGLSHLENAINDTLQENKYLIRLSRKYIINIKKVFQVNTVKQILMLNDDNGNLSTIHMPKPALRELMDILREKLPTKE